MVIRPYVLSALAVLPLVAPSIWNGFGVGLADPVLGVVSAAEQPLSVRSPGALWAMALVLSWLGLAYWRRNFQPWHAALVAGGTVAALVRAGNLWLLALALLVPLGGQLRHMPRSGSLAAACAGIAVALFTALATRPPSLPSSALAAVPSQATVLADWRWASALQRDTSGHVLAADGLRAQPIDFWVDYLRITQGHERWPAILRGYEVSVVVLNSTDTPLAADLVRASSDWHVLDDSDGAFVAERIR
jgi:hypothetical protein